MAAPDVGERDIIEVAGRVVVVENGVQRDRIREGVAAGPRLAIDHDDRVAGRPIDLFDGDQVQVKDFDHGAIFGPTDEAVAGDDGGFPEPRFDEVGQPEHAAEAVRVGLNVGHEHDPFGGLQPGQEAVGPALAGRGGFAATTVRVGASSRHGGSTSELSEPLRSVRVVQGEESERGRPKPSTIVTR